MRRIYLIEVLTEAERWIPMYQPCYSLLEAQAKLKRYATGKNKTRYRIGVYEFVGAEVK